MARHASLPQVVAIVLAGLFALAWVAGKLDAGVVLALAAVWIVFELVWDLRAPLRPRPVSDEDR